MLTFPSKIPKLLLHIQLLILTAYIDLYKTPFSELYLEQECEDLIICIY